MHSIKTKRRRRRKKKEKTGGEKKKEKDREKRTNHREEGKGIGENPLFRVTRKAYLAPLDHLPATILLESRELCSFDDDESASLKDFERRPLPPNQLLLDLLVVPSILINITRE